MEDSELFRDITDIFATNSSSTAYVNLGTTATAAVSLQPSIVEAPIAVSVPEEKPVVPVVEDTEFETLLDNFFLSMRYLNGCKFDKAKYKSMVEKKELNNKKIVPVQVELTIGDIKLKALQYDDLKLIIVPKDSRRPELPYALCNNYICVQDMEDLKYLPYSAIEFGVYSYNEYQLLCNGSEWRNPLYSSNSDFINCDHLLNHSTIECVKDYSGISRGLRNWSSYSSDGFTIKNIYELYSPKMSYSFALEIELLVKGVNKIMYLEVIYGSKGVSFKLKSSLSQPCIVCDLEPLIGTHSYFYMLKHTDVVGDLLPNIWSSLKAKRGAIIRALKLGAEKEEL